MGTGSSKETDGGSEGSKDRLDDDDQSGRQLYVSLKMENHKLTAHLVPHVVGSWESSKAVIFCFFMSSFYFSSILLNSDFFLAFFGARIGFNVGT